MARPCGTSFHARQQGNEPWVQAVVFILPGRQFGKLAKAVANKAHAVVCIVRNVATLAVLHALLGIREVAAALRAKSIERTIAQHAVEALACDPFVTREEIALDVLEEHVFVYIARHDALRKI